MKAESKLFVLLVSAGMVLATPVLAAGDGGSSSNANTCKSGMVWDKKTRKCVKQSSNLDQESLYEAGRDLALAERYEEAIKVLSLASAGNDKRVLNYLGYANRKLGRIEVGLEYYRQALALDPEYTLVREYLGEALLQQGDLDGALKQLVEIKRLCKGRSCSEYTDLAGQIADYVKKHNS
tara:strand:+ start:21469 stop:22008 length:540 start_codon:yes stop_codon:yes gene_type:complete